MFTENQIGGDTKNEKGFIFNRNRYVDFYRQRFRSKSTQETGFA